MRWYLECIWVSFSLVSFPILHCSDADVFGCMTTLAKICISFDLHWVNLRYGSETTATLTLYYALQTKYVSKLEIEIQYVFTCRCKCMCPIFPFAKYVRMRKIDSPFKNFGIPIHVPSCTEQGVGELRNYKWKIYYPNNRWDCFRFPSFILSSNLDTF